MGLPNNYLMTTKNVDSFFNSIISARAPERFTQNFLENLGFKSTNDRLFIGVLKSLGFLDEGGTPTQRYYDFLDQSQSKFVLGEAIKEAYSDLFSIRKDAQNLSQEEIKNKMRTLTKGKKSENVLSLMASTFKALSEYANFSEKRIESKKVQENKGEGKKEDNSLSSSKKISDLKIPSLNYNIQIHLPETRDSAVYDAIFKSLKEHLL